MARRMQSSGPLRELRGRISDNLTAWADALRQANADRSLLSTKRMMQTGPYSKVLWDMRSMGEEVRMRALRSLYHANGTPNVYPDPRIPATFSPKAIIKQILADEEILWHSATVYEREMASGWLTGNPMHAWIQTYPDGRMPVMFGVLQSPPGVDDFTYYERILPFDAACALARYLPMVEMYRSPGCPGELLAPPDPVREPALCPIFHNFAKGLLLLDRWCAPGSQCMCNAVIWNYSAPPPGHPQATGALIQQDTPPPFKRPGAPTPRHSKPNLDDVS